MNRDDRAENVFASNRENVFRSAGSFTSFADDICPLVQCMLKRGVNMSPPRHFAREAVKSEPTIFIKEHREYDPRDYPFLDAPDLVICRGKNMTYPEYVVARRLHFSRLNVPSPRNENRELNQDSPSLVLGLIPGCKASLAPEKATAPTQSIGPSKRH